jgi:hypothetical protein
MGSSIIKKIVFIYQEIGRMFLWGIVPVKSECKFYPSCSQYCLGVVEKHGAVQGTIRTGIRILRCSFLSQGGVDVP